MSDPPGSEWPPSVKPVSVANLRRLGIDTDNQLFWDGRRIEIRRPLVLTGVQKAAAIAVTAFAILGGHGGFITGLNNASVFLCARGVHWLGCAH